MQTPFLISKQDRDKIRSDGFRAFDSYALSCYKGVWDEGIGYDGDKYDYLYKTIIEENRGRGAENVRGNSCFYFEFQGYMSLISAEELEKRETIQKEAKADRKWIKRGVWGTFATAFATLLAVILGYILSKP